MSLPMVKSLVHREEFFPKVNVLITKDYKLYIELSFACWLVHTQYIKIIWLQALYSEKIWEQINALTMIVRYKAARQETCKEELKALYLFTGIEPPAYFKDTCDLDEVNAKLRFLKSVVGIKQESCSSWTCIWMLYESLIFF